MSTPVEYAIEIDSLTKVHFVNEYEEDLGMLAVVKTFSGFDPADTPIAAHISDRVLTLPMYADLPPETVDRICDIILG